MADLAFGPFTVDLANARVLREGNEIKLRPQAFHALRVLLMPLAARIAQLSLGSNLAGPQ